MNTIYVGRTDGWTDGSDGSGLIVVNGTAMPIRPSDRALDQPPDHKFVGEV